MELAKKVVSKFDKLRKLNNLPVKYPVNDFQFYIDGKYLFPDLVRLIAEAANVYNLGYDFNSKDHYTGQDYSRYEELTYLEEDGILVGLNLDIPDWLRAKGDERKAYRDEVMKRKSKE